MEIERKFTIKELPDNLEQYASHKISQAYLNENPVVRIRRQDDEYYMTYKGRGMMTREEYNLPLNKDAYEHLLTKADGNIISKTRYLIPLTNPKFAPITSSALSEVSSALPSSNSQSASGTYPSELMIELDVFDAPFDTLIMAEIEFPDEESANAYIPEEWFLEDVTTDKRYHNSNMVYSNL